MEAFITSLNVVLPLFLLMLAGRLLKRLKLFDEPTLVCLNRVNFKAFLPISLAFNIYNTERTAIAGPKFLLFSVGFVVVLFLVLCVAVPRFEHDNRRKGVMVQGIMRSNFLIFCLHMMSLLCPDQMGTAALAIAVIIPLINMLSVIALELYRGESPDFRKIFKGIISNPLIIASAAGLLFWILRIRIPQPVYSALGDLAKLGSPLALIVLGASVEPGKLSGMGKQVFWGVFCRLVVVPMIGIPLSMLMGFRGGELTCLMIMFSTPTAVSSYTMAQQMDADAELAGQLVVWSTLFSSITMFLCIFVLRSLHLI